MSVNDQSVFVTPAAIAWRDPQALMDAHEVVMHKVDRDRVRMVLSFFRKAVRQPSEPSHRHAHRQVLPLNVAR
jgi:hypothetical protein